MVNRSLPIEKPGYILVCVTTVKLFKFVNNGVFNIFLFCMKKENGTAQQS